MEFSGFFGAFYRVADWVTKFMGLNLLWLVFNIPIVYLVLSMLFVKNNEQFLTLGITIVLISPFIFFPATIAMFGVARKWIMKDDIKIIKFFWRYYKENYVRGMFGGLILSYVSLIIYYYYYYTTDFASWFIYIFIILGAFLLVFILNFLSLTVHVDTKLKEAFKIVFLLTLCNPIHTLVLAVLVVFIVYFSFNVITILIPFFMGSTIAYVSFYMFYMFYMKNELFNPSG